MAYRALRCLHCTGNPGTVRCQAVSGRSLPFRRRPSPGGAVHEASAMLARSAILVATSLLADPTTAAPEPAATAFTLQRMVQRG